MKIKEILRQCPEFITLYLEELTNSGIVLIDKSGSILDCNNGFLEIIGLKEKPLRHDIKSFLSINSKDFMFPEDSSVKINLLFINSSEVEMLLRGHIFPLNEYYLMIFEHHRLTYNELIKKMSKLNDEIVDITRELEKKNIQLKEALNTVRRIMNTDHLTGIINRRAFEKILKREISLALRHKLPLSFVMIDIDYFKKINDTYGHEAGDHVLKTFAKKLKKLIRQEDILGRFGGEEFALLLPYTNIENAFQAVERIRQRIERVKIKGIKGNITASFGITEILPTDDDKSLVKRADDALYEAKAKGRNRCEIK